MSKDYIKTGAKFHTTVGPGSFQRKFRADVLHGAERHFADNVQAIVSGIKKYEPYIRRGGLSRMQRMSAFRHIVKQDKNMTMVDKRALKKLLGEFKPQEKSNNQFEQRVVNQPKIVTPEDVVARRNQLFASRVDTANENSHRAGYAQSSMNPAKTRPGYAFSGTVKKFALAGSAKFSGYARNISGQARRGIIDQAVRRPPAIMGPNSASSIHTNNFSRSASRNFFMK